MTNMPDPQTCTQPMAASPEVKPEMHATALVKEYLLEHLPVYRELCDIRKELWAMEEGDAYFQRQREQTDNASHQMKKGMFSLMRAICLEIDAATSGLTIRARRKHRPAILDLCMAPGGFAMAAMNLNRSAIIRGITLPTSQGGHEMMLRKFSETDPEAKVFVDFRDITMLSDEMGVAKSSIPPDHPDASSFSSDRPFEEEKFDLVFCDGQVLRTHERGEYREKVESTRLLTSQLVLALQRIRWGGTMVILLHRAESWRTVKLIHTFSLFSERVELFKPLKAHKMRSSFYMVAKNVKPGRDAALEAVNVWKEQWKQATFGVVEVADGGETNEEGERSTTEWKEDSEEKVKAVLEEYGDDLVRMMEPIFATQAAALRNAPWANR
ncbi:S-adenosyl-L-methionine-dependent methyltransferase-like protein [Cladorrhinum sp. PSN259]|nr:S-adenosyl-L-methionine-dependent methyltransferase-like protein [Cladorrhinum sp. PSN259]